MKICKAPTLRLKALNKHTHILYTEMENVIKKKKEKSTMVFKHFARNMRTNAHAHAHARTHARTHAHTHTQSNYGNINFT